MIRTTPTAHRKSKTLEPEFHVSCTTVYYPIRIRSKSYEQERLFGDEVFNQFPSARMDIQEAGNCYAMGRYTACVFHSMRVVERGLRAVADNLDLPLGSPNWHDIIGLIEKDVKAKENTKKDKSRDEELKFYSAAAQECRHFKHLWRNDVMHAQGEYDEHEAKSIFVHVDAFMRAIATKLSEVPA